MTLSRQFQFFVGRNWRAEASPHPSKEWRPLRDGLALDFDDQLSLASSFFDVLYVFRVTGQPRGFAHEAIKRVFIFFLPHLIHVRAE